MEPATGIYPRASAPVQPDRHPHQPGHSATDLPDTATASGYAGAFPGRADQVSQVRREIADYLGAAPATGDMILIASELAANAILHTQSRGSTFTVRCQLSAQSARIEVEDLGGPWRTRQAADRPHGLDIIAALTGPDGWGTQPAAGGRIVWARLSW